MGCRRRGAVGEDTDSGIVIIQKVGGRESVEPKARMGALACATLAEDHIGSSVTVDAGSVNGNADVKQYNLREECAHQR